MLTPLNTRVFLTADEVAELLNVSGRSVRRWSQLRTDDFPSPAIHRGKVMRWRRVRVMAWIEQQERSGAAR